MSDTKQNTMGPCECIDTADNGALALPIPAPVAVTPRVSICVPNLNALPFVRERFETIFGKLYQTGNCSLYDSPSDDGAWEFMQNLARREGRMRIAQVICRKN